MWIAAVTIVSGCHYDPYPWPRPGQPGADKLEAELSQRDSLREATDDLSLVAAQARQAISRVWPSAQWSQYTHGGEADCSPPFTFLHGSVYELPHFSTPASELDADRNAIMDAVEGVLREHHAVTIERRENQEIDGTLGKVHGHLLTVISTPPNSHPPDIMMQGATGCHNATAGPGH